ncbi:decaprenyl-phosphate phosphoribosyltransferase [Azospirillum sp. ST 5-10]|uniref:decaprenyl-phosphate phosphoribosyltransferase n=1 Tax=unclassified Azospirillum TaxID=2630922 RepID=UPI003F49C8C1
MSAGRRVLALARLMRPHQWIKNGFVLAPLFFTPSAVSTGSVVRAVLAALCFCLVASAVYIVNDYVDREADRSHPTKRLRPIAAGLVSPALAFAAMAALLAAGLGGAFLLAPAFMAFAAAYLMLNLGYSLRLKHVAILDVLIIAVGFVMRVEAGAVVVAITPSVWILVCTFLLALFLALAKRRDDLVRDLGASHRKALDGYNKPFLDTAFTVVVAALVVSYIIYTTDDDVVLRMETSRLYLTIPFVVAGVFRYLQLTLVEERSGSPTRIAVSDPFMVATILGWIATFAALIYL